MATKKTKTTKIQTTPPPGDATERPRERGRKDRVLQARVSKSLYQDLAARARRLRVPVSNLVRNILEDSLTMVENIVDGGLDIAEALGGKATDEEIASVLGWQPMVAGRRIACCRCGRPIDKGADAFSSVGAPGGRTLVICKDCQCGL